MWSEVISMTPARRRFRRLIRIVMREVRFFKSLRATQKKKDGIEDSGPKPTVFTCGALAPAAKRILRADPWARTPTDLATVQQLVGRLRCFQKYSAIKLLDIARIVHYECYPAGARMLQQGHPGLAFYFILSGHINIGVAKGGAREEIVNSMGPGDSFGELALLDPNNIRTASVICKTAAEFLRVDKFEFDMILRHSHEQEARRKYLIMRTHAFFRTWTDTELNEAVQSAHLKSFAPGAVLFDGYHSHPGETVCILVAGSCRIVRRVPVTVLPSGGLGPASSTLHMTRPVEGKESLMSLGSRAHVLVTTDTLVPGAMFGAWTSGTSAVCACRCTTLLVAKSVFMRHDHGRSLDQIRTAQPLLCMADRDLYAAYQQQQQWQAYKQHVLRETIRYTRLRRALQHQLR
eukprot:m.234622 g.234622  ORF g.234622 m.234622 type:complete len:405 (+) comp19695_c0_seq1:417-1631(+)